MRKAPGPKIEGSRILHIVTCENQASTERTSHGPAFFYLTIQCLA